jgi:hypothetical protein
MSAVFTADHVLQPAHPRQEERRRSERPVPGSRQERFCLPNGPGAQPCGGRVLEASVNALAQAGSIPSLRFQTPARRPQGTDMRVSFDPRGSRRAAPRVSLTVSGHKRPQPPWWSQTGSNRRPQACKASALPTELWPLRGGGRRVSEEDGGPGTTRTSDLTLIRGAL